MIRIYICYARQDRAVAERLRDLLQEYGIEARIELDISPGAGYEFEAARVIGGGVVCQRTRVALLAMTCRGILHIPDCAAAAPSTFRKKHSTNNMV